LRAASADPRAPARSLWRAALGLACLDAAFALVVVLAAHPPQRPQEVRFVLRSAPMPSAPLQRAERSAPPRAVVVAIADASPAVSAAPRVVKPVVVAPPESVYSIEVPIGTPVPRAPDVATLVEPAASSQFAARVDALARAPRPVALARVADEVHDAPRAPRTSGRIGVALATPPVPSGALRDPAHGLTRAADRMLSAPAAPPIMPRAPIVVAAAAVSDRLIPSTATLVSERAAAPRRIAWLGADRLTPSPAAHLLHDEVAWSTTRAWSSEPPPPELSPAVRPSPAVLLARLLPELTTTPRTTGLKTEFVSLLLPLVMRVNEQILRERERVVALAPELDAGLDVPPSDERAAGAALQAAGLDGWDTRELLLRLDAVPLSMALAQAAQESGWGRSRPAREDNALFGQTEFLHGRSSRVQSFDDLLETVNAYARNLNTHPAYAEFRRRRAALRARGDKLDGPALVAFIQRYSERGPRYIEAIRNVMRINNLSVLDATMLDAALDGAVPVLAGVALDRAALDKASLDGSDLGGPGLDGPPLEALRPRQGMDN